jgi:hypothetical protein
MPDNNINDVLKALSAKDLHIDQFGRVVITNTDIASKLANAGVKPGAVESAGNIICTGSSAEAARELLAGVRNRIGG